MTENELTRIIIGCAIEVHRVLGPGLLESTYQECLMYELIEKGIRVEREKRLPIQYKGIKLDQAYRIDLLVENSVVVELKSVDQLIDIHIAQTLTYMRLGEFSLGLLLNFKVKKLKDGIKRLVL